MNKKKERKEIGNFAGFEPRSIFFVILRTRNKRWFISYIRFFCRFSTRIPVTKPRNFPTFYHSTLKKCIQTTSNHQKSQTKLDNGKSFSFSPLHSFKSSKKHSFQYLLPFFCYIEQFFDIKSESQTTFIFIYVGTKQSKSSFDFLVKF